MKDDDVVVCEEITRKEVLLRAAYDLLTKCERSYYVLSATDTTIFYDGAKRDGSCLRKDIAVELDIDSDSEAMLLAILRMPIDLAMSTELARTQYWFRGQEAADQIELNARLIEELRETIRDMSYQVDDDPECLS